MNTEKQNKAPKTPQKSSQGDLLSIELSETSATLRYPKKEKLKSKKRIAQLFEEGNGLTVYPLKLIYLKADEQEVPIKAGVTVSKKNFKRAVTRNRIKRLLRESYRLNKPLVFNNTAPKFTFLFLYLGKEMPTFKAIEHKMKLLLNKFNASVHEKNTP